MEKKLLQVSLVHGKQNFQAELSRSEGTDLPQLSKGLLTQTRSPEYLLPGQENGQG